MNIVLRKPIISEKSMQLAARGEYTFLVDKKVRKPEIAKAVKERFGVEVMAVRTVIFKDEIKRQRRHIGSYTISGFKKAIVLLPQGQKIPLFETPKESSEEVQVKEKKSFLKGTKVKIEKGPKTKTELGSKNLKSKAIKKTGKGEKE